jgi:hypothetical protein
MNEAVMRAFVKFRPSPAYLWHFADLQMWRAMKAQIENFPAHALPDPENPTVLCGCVHSRGVGELWMVTGTGFRRSAPTVLAQQRQLAADIYRALGLHRLEMRIDARRKEAWLWAGKLGFRHEATLKRAGREGNDTAVFIWPDKERDQS